MYRGEITELPLGWDGLTGTKNVSQVLATQLLIANNITYENGTLSKEGGAILYTPSPIIGAPVVLGGYDWWPNASVQRSVVVISGGKILKDSGSGAYGTTLKSGLNAPSKVVTFAEGGQEVGGNTKKLFICTGSNQCQVLAADGVVTANIATPPADWAATFPVMIFPHVNRMWGFGGADPHRLYYGTLTNHEDFTGTGSGTVAIYPGDGQEISGAISFKQRIIVFKKPFGIYVVDTTDPNAANWTVARLSRNIGCAGPLLVSNSDDDVMFMDNVGSVHVISAVREFGDVGLRSVSYQVLMDPFIRDRIDLSRLAFGQSIFYIAKREIHFALTAIGTANNNRRLVVDLNTPPKYRFRYSDRDTCESVWMRRDTSDVPRPQFGDASGQVWMADNASKAKNNLAYEGRFKTPHYDMSWLDPKNAAKKKNFDYIEFVQEPLGNYTLSVDVYIDGKFKYTLTFATGVSGAGLGTFVLDTSVLGNDQVSNIKKRIVGEGRRISLEVYNANAGEDFSIAKALLYWRPGKE